jgi:DNA-binding NtrC family response regulator
VVDDEESIRRSLQRFFTRRGHRVEIAEEGHEALGLIDAQGAGSYDVILSDLRMPGLGGEQLLQALAERGRGLEARLVFMSGDSASTEAERAFATASVPVVEKPFDLGSLLELVERHAAAAATL